MLLDMALGSAAPCTSFQHRYRATTVLLLIVCVTLTQSAPTAYDEIQAKRTDLSDYFNDPNGCYYNYQHYEEGDRIVTNEPCLNCTCHNRMLMCYLRVCPFSKAIGQDCTVQKSPDQCCPVISCPEVPVHLLTSSTTQTPSTTTVGWRDDYGCMMNEDGFFPDGAQVPSNPAKPCELCYCIRNRTACVMQECTLHVEGCKPVYQDGVCCPVRYDCDYESEKSTTAAPQISGGLVFSTTSAPFDCKVNDEVYRDGESIAMNDEKPCEHCYCMRGDIVCAVQDCGEPLRGKDCTPETPKSGHCCPTSYQCANETIISDDIPTLQPASQSDENEAEKYPSNEDAYDKLGENQPNQDDDTNDVENSEPVHTTTADEMLPVGIQEVTTVKNENANDVVTDNNNVAGEQNILPVGDSPNKINEENKQETSSTQPESTNNETPVSTESDQINYGSTGKPVELTSMDEAQPTQSPVADISSNENEVSPTVQTTSDENKINELNNENKSPVDKPSQENLASGLPVSSTEKSIESETQISFVQDKPQEETQQSTDIPSAAEKEPIKSSTTNDIQDPTKQNNEESTGNIIPTGSPLNEDTEQATQKLPQNDSEKTTSEESNVQTDTTSNIEKDSPEQSNQDTTQPPQVDNTQTDILSNLGQSSPSNDNSQEEKVSSTETPKVDNDVVDQNKLPVENKPQAENKPETETKPTEQDGLQTENASPTETPNVANEPIEQNKPLEENNPQGDGQSESEQTSTEQNQDIPQSENVSPTEIPKVENEPTEQNKPSVESSSQVDTQTESDKKPAEQVNQDSPQTEETSSTEIPEVENEPTEQNKPLVESSSPTDTQPESQQSSTEQNQDIPQSENVSPTEIPKVENEPTEQNKPTMESSSQANTQSESDKTPAEQVNQDSPQTDEVSSTEIPEVENEPTKQNKPLVESNQQADNAPESQQSLTEQNQDIPQSENVSPTEIPKVENEPTDQNKPTVESNSQTDVQPGLDKTPAEQINQDSPQSENESPTEIPKVENEPTEQNKPLVDSNPQADNAPESQQSSTEQNQDTTQSQNLTPTEIPKVENEPVEQNKPSVESSSQNDTQPESQQSSTEQNQDIPQSENVSPTEIPKVENEPTEQNKPTVESSSQSDAQTESDKKPAEQINQDSPQSENVSPTEIPKVENEPTEQNKPLVENGPQADTQPESLQSSTEQNQDTPQSENVSPTEIPKAENEPTEQNKPSVESSSQVDTQTESDKKPAEQINQDSPQSENVSPTEIPKVENEPTEQNKPLVESSSLADTQPESQQSSTEQNQDSPQLDSVVPQTEVPVKLNEPQSENVVPQNDASTPQPIEDNNMFVVSPTSPPLFSENQIKDEQPTSALNEDDKKPQSSADDKTAVENVSADNVPTTVVTEKAPESNSASPQTNDESSTETKPTVNDVTSDVTSSPVIPNEQAPVGIQQIDIKSDSGKPINSESELTATTEINSDVNQEITKPGVLVDDSSSENEPIDSAEGENHGVSNADTVENQNIPQNEIDTSTNPSSVDEHENDVTTSIPQEQIADNNIPIQPETVNPNEPPTVQDDTKKPSEPSDNSTPQESPVSNLPNKIGGVQSSDEITNPTESPVSDTGNAEQSVATQSPVQNGEFETVGPLDENVNEIVDQTSVSPDISSGSISSTAIVSDQNNEEVTPQSDQIETGTNVPVIPSSEEPVKSTNEDASTENESTTVSQVSQDISNNAANEDITSTTNKYAEVPSIVSPTDTPASQGDETETLSPVSGDTETNEDISTNSPIQEPPNSNVNDNVEVSTNVPSSGVLNEVDQDSNTDSELDVTQSPTDKNEAADDSNKKPTNDANEIVDEKSTEIPQSIGVPSGPDYVIDLTSSSETPNMILEPIKTDDQANPINEFTTISDADKNSDATTQLYENAQQGVPGEGSCLIDFVTYAHKAEVPKSNPCHEKCECLNSIVTCTSVNCPPAPPQHRNCIPLHPGNESWCCPTYMCEGGIEGMLFDNHNQLGSPQLISTVVLEDKPGEENDEKTPIFEEVPSTYTPQTAVEYNTLAPSQTGMSSDTNSQEAIGATEIPIPTEIPNKQVDDSVATANDENNAPVTIATNLESEGNAKPSENESPVVSDKPIESDQPSENEKPVENVQSETGKPIDDSAADVATVPYTADIQSVTNKPETINNVEEQNTLPVNTADEAQNYPASSTEEPSYESTVKTEIPAGNENQSEQQNPELDGSTAAATVKPSDSVVDQQIVDDNKAAEETGKPNANEESPEAKPADNVTDLPPASDVSPVEVTQTPTIVADEKPSHGEDNVGGSRPSSIDDIISSVNMVKDAVKNSLETSSKPAEIDYPTTDGMVESYQPTVVPEPASPPSEDSSPIVGDVNGAPPQVQTDAIKLPESSAVTESADEAGATQVPSVVPSVNTGEGETSPSVNIDQGETLPSMNVDQGETSPPVNAGEGEISPPVNADQGVSTDVPSVVPDKQESSVVGPSAVDQDVPQPEEAVPDKTPEVTVAPSVPSPAAEGDLTNDAVGPVGSTESPPQVNVVESIANAPAAGGEGVAAAVNDKTPETSPVAGQPEVPAEEEKPEVVPVSPPKSDAVADKVDVVPEIATPSAADRPSSMGVPQEIGNVGYEQPDQPSGTAVQDDTKRPAAAQESGDTVNIPFDTERPSHKPFGQHKPSYTPIPQSTWTQKPFHHDSTSEAPQPPDQGFPDEYDDENEAVYGPGTCRYGGKVYVSAQQVPRDDPCDFCFCFRGDIICLQQSCPPPIFGCYQENIQGFCCPRYECPVAQATSVNVTTTTTTTTTTVPPHFLASAYRGMAKRSGCMIHGHAYRVGEEVAIASNPCLECKCGANGSMNCEPRSCSPEPLIRKMMTEPVDQSRRR